MEGGRRRTRRRSSSFFVFDLLVRVRDLVLELRPAVGARRHRAPIPKLLQLQHLFLKATAQMDRPSHEDVCWLEVAVNAASVVDEAQPLENAVQDVAHAALCEGGFLQELAHVDLVQVEHEPNVGRPPLGNRFEPARRMWILPEEAQVD